MLKILKLLQKNLILSIPIFMVLGLLFGFLFQTSFLKSWIVPLTFLMVYPMMVTLNMEELISKSNNKIQTTAIIINFAITPFIGYFIGKLVFPDNPLVVLGLLLTSLLPTSGMTISWTGFAKGNMSAAVKMTIIGLIVGSLATPLYLKALMGTVVSISLIEVFSQIISIVFLPLIAGYLTQIFLKKRYGVEIYENKYKPKFPLLSTIGVLGVVFISMALKSKTILSNPVIILYYLIPLIILYVINFAVSTIIGKVFFNREDGIALVYGTVMRNLSIALAIAMGVFGEKGSEIALIIALAYVIQVQAAAWYVKFTDMIFGEAL
ncbi:MAG: bile acid:sodium symporter [Sedimentibacter sp.]|uniref:arsenic resistance protein n=1 Tax=Sedimentibacter sp. TaxID=1960295 RepID=UPI002981E856|nr:bile acid:sodium symporter [Sedimentibacter sp.]MDW5299782.1 bile acid:sodium symporter [Sedimentibacter sp.]